MLRLTEPMESSQAVNAPSEQESLLDAGDSAAIESIFRDLQLPPDLWGDAWIVLNARCARGPLPWSAACDIVTAVARTAVDGDEGQT